MCLKDLEHCYMIMQVCQQWFQLKWPNYSKQVQHNQIEIECGDNNSKYELLATL
jgi:hypothetical protein